MISDLNKSGIDVQFVDDVSKSLAAGKAAVLAEVEADLEARHTKLKEAGRLAREALSA